MVLFMVSIAGSVPIEIGPSGVAVSSDGTKIYVANSDNLSNIEGSGNTIFVIDTATNEVTAVPVGIGPFGIAVSPDGTKVYVANRLDNTTSVIDTLNNSVITVVPVGIYPSGVTANLDGTKIYVTSAISNNVSIIDTATNTFKSTVNLGNETFAFGNFRDLALIPMPIQEALKRD